MDLELMTGHGFMCSYIEQHYMKKRKKLHGRGCQEQMRRMSKKIDKIDKLNGINYILVIPHSVIQSQFR